VNCLSAENCWSRNWRHNSRWHFLANPNFTCHTEIHIPLKYTAPWHATVVTNCNWKQMTYGVDNCCLLVTNHKQTLKHEPHCSPWNIIPSSGPQVNYFSSFQMLSVVRHGDSLAKFVCASRQAAHCSPWSAEPWTGQQSLKQLSVKRRLKCSNNLTAECWDGPNSVSKSVICPGWGFSWCSSDHPSKQRQWPLPLIFIKIHHSLPAIPLHSCIFSSENVLKRTKPWITESINHVEERGSYLWENAACLLTINDVCECLFRKPNL
jgi:hypothetical protein